MCYTFMYLYIFREMLKSTQIKITQSINEYLIINNFSKTISVESETKREREN